jgi:hypothetical protein
LIHSQTAVYKPQEGRDMENLREGCKVRIIVDESVLPRGAIGTVTWTDQASLEIDYSGECVYPNEVEVLE